MSVMGLVLYSTMALSSPYLQNVVGYPIITAGLLLATRGSGTFVAMMLVGRLMRYIEARTLIISGLSLTGLSLFYMTGWTDQTGVPEIVTVSIVQGFGFGLVFVPLTTVAFLTLPNHLRTDGTSMLTLLRNVASSVGISIVIAQLTEGRAGSMRSCPSTSIRSTTRCRCRMSAADRPEFRRGPCVGGRRRRHTGPDHRLFAGLPAGDVLYPVLIPLAIIIGSTKAALRASRLTRRPNMR